MSYAGIARSDSEREAALELAAASFSQPDAPLEEAIHRKSNFLHQHPGFGETSVIVVCNRSGLVVGSAFLINSDMPVGKRLLKSVFISSVSIAEKFRGQGVSVLLMQSAISAATERGADIAIVIARRAVDGYYTRFGFWGMSQYSKVKLELATLPSDNHPARSVLLKPVTRTDVGLCATLYAGNYSNLFGHCLRKPKMWEYILQKLPYLGLRFDLVLIDGERVGYVVHDGNGDFHEIGVVSSDILFSPRVFLAACAPECKSVTLHIHATHPFLSRLEGADVSLILRECPYGGHMVRILSSAFGKLANADAAASANLSFSETAKLLCLSRVTNIESAQGLGLRASFNIPLLDQI